MEEIIIFLLCVTLSVIGMSMFSQKAFARAKKAILVISFGTSYADTRKVTIEACENKIQETFSNYEVRRAFTSNIIIKIMKERDNIVVDTPEEALQKLQDEGFSEVIVQPLHVIPGVEFHDIVAIVKKYEPAFDTIRLGAPLLTTIHDYMAVADAINRQLPDLGEHDAVAFMGHGTHHPANAAYATLERVFEDNGMKHVFVGTVEGYPEFEHVLKRLQDNKIEKVTLMPFMLVAGDHAQNDMAGDEEDSWKTMLKKEGIVVEAYLHGLGENPAIQDIYVQHVKDTIEGEAGGH
jgi:sirohydrochlorin cobaltochelatase